MKQIFLILNLIFRTMVSMASPEPIVTKTTGGGFVMPSYHRLETCRVFADRVEITRQYGFSQNERAILTETRAIQIKADIKKLLAAVAGEELKQGNPGPCDIPTTTIEAGRLKLFFTGACGTNREERQGPASKMLVEIAALYCPQTVDFGAGH